MAAGELRRSSRLSTYDSNGREYLADNIGWPREQLESWVLSPSVQPHLQLWYRLCVTGERRFNDAIEWINTGERGYFYHERDLEDDLLLMCLCEGSHENDEDEERGSGQESAGYDDEKVKTEQWVTQELWARTAWRIVQSNKGRGQAFEKYADEHPAACYGFVIDLLCLAFHSIAFRGRESIYERLINESMGPKTIQTDESPRLQKELAVEASLEESDAASTASMLSTGPSSNETTDHSSDADFSDDQDRTEVTNESSVSPQKTDCDNRAKVEALQRWVVDVSPRPNAAGIPCQDMAVLHLVSEDGKPITGYRRKEAVIGETQPEETERIAGVDVGVLEAKNLSWAAN